MTLLDPEAQKLSPSLATDDTPERVPDSSDALDLDRSGAARGGPVPQLGVAAIPPAVDSPGALSSAQYPRHVARERGHPREGAAASDAPDLYRGGAARGRAVPELAVGAVAPAVHPA